MYQLARHQLVAAAALAHYKGLYQAHLAYALGQLGYGLLVKGDAGLVGVGMDAVDGKLQ